ncbi:mps one binder kinase activator-like 1 protein [Hyaloraphidium curvatum]|nr:mps one binder kinase activator-like 1 protein [Hyaloraphidium curvatum]
MFLRWRLPSAKAPLRNPPSSKLTGGGRKKPAASPSGPRPPYLVPPHPTIVSGSVKRLVELPAYVDYNEWLAINTFDFFQYVNMLYGVISESCTTSTCPTMSGPSGAEYPWIDSQRKILKVSAPQYVDFATTLIQSQLNDESIFPTKAGLDFPKDFVPNVVKPIFRHLFRVLAHLYHAHFEAVVALGCEAHLNTLFANIWSFGTTFDLLDKKEASVLAELVEGDMAAIVN